MTEEQLRLEALKLAYEVSFKTDELSKHKTPEQRYEALMDIFKLAKVNYFFMKSQDVQLESLFK